MGSASQAISEETDVVIIGAGLAGLAAARDVIKAGLSCIILEARDRVGGSPNAVWQSKIVVQTGGDKLIRTFDQKDDSGATHVYGTSLPSKSSMPTHGPEYFPKRTHQ